MANKGRGGYRQPKGGPRVSGPGAFSQRTDTQPVRVPDFGTSEDLTFGDKQRLEAAQRQQPIPQQASPRVARPAPTGPPSPAGGPGVLPEFLFGMPTNRPMEPASEGLAMGPGAGPEVLSAEPSDPAEEVLQKLVDAFGDEFATNMLTDLRNQRGAPTPVEPSIPEEGAPLGEEVDPDQEPGIVDFPMGEEEEPMVEEEGEGEEVAPTEETAAAVRSAPEEAVAEASVEGTELV